MNYFVKNSLDMNFYLKSDSYSAALSIIQEGIGISIVDDNTITRTDDNLVNISNILDTEFKCIILYSPIAQLTFNLLIHQK